MTAERRNSWERAMVVSSLVWSVVVVGLALVVAGTVLHPAWVGLAYLASLALGLRCGRRCQAGQRTRAVRVLSWLLGKGDPRPALSGVLASGVLVTFVGLMLAHLEGCRMAAELALSSGVGIEDVFAPMESEIRDFQRLYGFVETFSVIAGTLAALFAGMADGMWIGRVSARRGISALRFMSDWKGWKTWREERWTGRRDYWRGGVDVFD